MAHIAIEMTATGGIADEHCDGCGKAFARGETMHGIEYDNGDPGGWHCDECVQYWREHGEPRKLERTTT
ncbi:MAG: hypothetical protein LLG01_00875 [Planctomycetaceae bacterium]|nr:hypothetical protein [Planctomycetaceae bacterium]